MHSVIKSTFYVLFIIISLFVGISMLTNTKGDKRVRIFGFIVLFLGIGESFHIVPRIIEIFTDNTENLEQYISNGRFIASFSIIVVYLLLFWFWKVYYKISTSKHIDYLLLILAGIGMILSVVFKTSDDTLFILIRNLPTIFIGVFIVYYYRVGSLSKMNNSLRFVWLAVLLSIVFTIGFELLNSNYPFFIILMMPKTLVYIWLIIMGYLDYKKI